ncbi:hypothetical protein [Lentzea xinjiangensis]|uniref:hypothetical protein n=1 Tax=Lentzea xinjiangensis TaxID=402600 RepID=UPI000B193684|nr:hypothetical protein [Lentzea xinjiangensis]
MSRFMTATGVWIGEVLAVYWEDIDFEAGTVDVNYTVIRAAGLGLIRKSTKTEAGERTLPRPRWALDIVRRRHEVTLVSERAGLPEQPPWPARPVEHPQGHPERSWRGRVRLGDLAGLPEDGGHDPR